MRVSEAKELLRTLVCSYFSEAEVTFTRQSRIGKPALPLITLTPGNVRRPQSPVYAAVDGVLVAHYESRMSVQVDLFTHGAPVVDDDTGRVVAYSDSAVDDMSAFVDFLNSPHTIEWCDIHDVSVLVDGDIQDLTGLVNDNNYEYRSQLSILFYFTQTAVEHAGILHGIGDAGFEQSSSGGGSKDLADEKTGCFSEVEIE